MKRPIALALGTTLMLASAALPSKAADQTIKVALLDMTSIMPGMMGYGMMGPGMMGNGMMGTPGYGMMGQGTTSQGTPGYSMMGQGMMGQGQGMMMGMMAIRADQQTVKAGSVKLDITNWSRSVLHEVLIVAVTNPTTPLPYDYTQAKVPEDQVKVLAEAGDIQPNASSTIKADLSSGSYLLICNIPGHYASGMTAFLNVVP